jgi:hypothetical protein
MQRDVEGFFVYDDSQVVEEWMGEHYERRNDCHQTLRNEAHSDK